MESPIRVLVADDHALFRQGLQSLLKRQRDMTVVGETDRLDAVGRLLAATPCDMLLLDLQMERGALGELPALAARVPVVVVTASEHPDELLAAVRAGARAVVLKRFAVETLVEAIRAVAAGHVWLPPPVQAAMAAGYQEASSSRLTRREVEMVRHVALGQRNADIAKKLGISEETVKAHLKNVFHKLGMRDRVELALYAVRTGLVSPPEL